METEKPAITICPHGSTKFTVAERLGNFLSTKADIPNEIFKWQHLMVLCVSIFSKKFLSIKAEIYEKWCIQSEKMKEACQVSLFLSFAIDTYLQLYILISDHSYLVKQNG